MTSQTSGEPTKQDILNAIIQVREKTMRHFDELDKHFYRALTSLDGIKVSTDRIISDMITKEYLDKKIKEFRDDLRAITSSPHHDP